MTQPSPTVRITGAASVVTGVGPTRGPLTTWADVGLQRDCDLVVARKSGVWQIQWLGKRADSRVPAHDHTIDLAGTTLLPGLIDAHTHAVFAGDRSGDFSRRMAGATYAEIAAEGGGILTTVRQTRAATVDALCQSAAGRLEQMWANGVRVVEIKTGYGLNVAAELKLLAAIDQLAARFAGRLAIVATAMPAHAIPPEWRADPAGYVREVVDQILPALAASPHPCRFVDVFVEQGYFDLDAANAIAAAARQLGWGLKAHVDEFVDLGGVAWAVGAGATSVEHLLTTSDAGIEALAKSDTVAVCLPLTSLYLREGYAPMRKLVEAGALVAVATDCNPGSAMTTNLPLAMQIAMLNGALSPMECVRGVTSVAAKAVGCPGGYDGTLRVGGPFVASRLAVSHPDELFYQLGAPPLGLPIALP